MRVVIPNNTHGTRVGTKSPVVPDDAYGYLKTHFFALVRARAYTFQPISNANNKMAIYYLITGRLVRYFRDFYRMYRLSYTRPLLAVLVPVYISLCARFFLLKRVSCVQK